MSTDRYEADLPKHGSPHIDRYTKNRRNVGRYTEDKAGIPHNGKLPPKIPEVDSGKFQEAANKVIRYKQHLKDAKKQAKMET